MKKKKKLEPDKNLNIENEEKNLSIRSKRRIVNKGKNEFVIKTKLLNSLYTNNNINDRIISLIQSRVEQTSKGLQRLSFAMNLFIRDLIDKKKNPLDVILPKFLTDKDNTFPRQLMIGLENARKPNEYIKSFIEKRNNLLPPVQNNIIGCRNIISKASEQYVTNYRTYLSEAFNNKQNDFIRVWCNKHNIDCDFNIIKSMINGNTVRKSYVPTEKVLKLIEFHRKLLNLQNEDFVSSVWIKNNYERVIIYFYVLSKYLIKHGHSGYTVAPMSKIKACFIHIDTYVLHGILNEAKILNCNIESFVNDKDAIWRNIFNINKFLTNRQRQIYDFTNTIESDGTSICIHYRRPKIDNDNNKDSYEYIYKEGDRIIGQDPGRVNLFTGVERLNNGTWKKYILTKKCYYEKSGINNCNKKTAKWNLHIKNVLVELSNCNTRSTTNQFINYINVVNQNYDLLWNFYLNDKWSKQRLKLYSKKQSVYDKFFNTIKDKTGRRVVIAYGDAGFASSNKNEISAPTSKLLKETKKHFKVVMVDEYNTTKMHFESGVQLSKITKIYKKTYNYKNGKPVLEEKIRQLRDLLCYRSNKGCKFVVRDFNAAKNIENCLRLYPYRPIQLRRPNDNKNINTIKIEPQYIVYSKSIWSKLIRPKINYERMLGV